MATATIGFDDALLAQVRQAAGEDLSKWIAAACRSRLLAEAAAAVRAWEESHPAEAVAARAQDAARVLEDEVERELCEQAEHAAQSRAGAGSEPTIADYLAAYSHVRALLEQGEQQLRDQLGGES